MSAWWTRWLPGSRAPVPGRWVVLDVESSGLDPHHDRLLAIAALAVDTRGGVCRLCPGDSFEVVLRQDDLPARPDKANILVHGIGVEAQRSGQPAAEAMADFARFAGDSPLVGFHAAFDRALIERQIHTSQGGKLSNPWLDLAELAPALRPEAKAHALDDWLALYGITVAVRHQAASDTWATAELLQRLWPLARAQGVVADFAGFSRLAASRRWLAP